MKHKRIDFSRHADLPLLKRISFYTLIFCLMAHAYMYFALAPIHDALASSFVTKGEIGVMLGLGRFTMPVYWLLRGYLHVPWFIGMLTILYLSGSTYLIARLLGIKGRFSIPVLCGILSTNITLTSSNSAYIGSSDAYMLTLLLTCIGVWAWENLPPHVGCPLSVVLFAGSMGIDQAYITVAIGLALILLIRHALEDAPFPEQVRRAMLYGASLLGGALLYYLLLKLSLRVSGIDMYEGVNGLNHVLDGSIISHVKLIPGAYADFFGEFFSPSHSYNTPFVCVCSALTAVAGLILWIKLLRRRHVKGLALLTVILCALLLPLGLNFVYILSDGLRHSLMSYSFYLMFAVVLMALDDLQDVPAADTPHRSSLGTFALVLCGCLILHNIQFANGAYYKVQLVFEGGSQYAFSIVETMEQNPDYEPGATPVAVIGTVADSYLPRKTDSFPAYRDLAGTHVDAAVTYLGSFGGYCYNVLGHPVSFVSDENELAEIAAKSAVKQMPVFPKEGYCRMVDGIMVVKLSD